jgi:hypothetical protein
MTPARQRGTGMYAGKIPVAVLVIVIGAGLHDPWHAALQISLGAVWLGLLIWRLTKVASPIEARRE